LLAEAGQFLPLLFHFFLDLNQPLLGVLFGFFFQLARGKFELHEPALHLIDFRRYALEFHRETTGSLVHEVDRLIGQEAVADVAVRKLRRRDERGILDSHALVMGFVARLESTQNRDRIFHTWLADEHWLEPAFERGIFFDVLAILVERGGPDATQFAACEGGLEQVRRVVAAFGRTGTDDRVQFVDEHDDVAGVHHFLDDRLEPLFKFAAELRAGDERPHIERDWKELPL
jgi:hypothetical protein